MKIVELRLISVVFAVIFLSGCSSGTLSHTTFKPASINELRTSVKLAAIRKQNIPELKGGQIVNIQNFYTKPEVVRLGFSSTTAVIRIVEIGADGYDADLKQFTRSAIAMLSKALKHRNIKRAKTGLKQVKLRVHSVKYNQGAFSAEIEGSVTAELGNGKSITATGKNSSASNLPAAASAALSYAIDEILNHHDFIQYMNQ